MSETTTTTKLPPMRGRFAWLAAAVAILGTGLGQFLSARAGAQSRAEPPEGVEVAPGGKPKPRLVTTDDLRPLTAAVEGLRGDVQQIKTERDAEKRKAIADEAYQRGRADEARERRGRK